MRTGLIVGVLLVAASCSSSAKVADPGSGGDIATEGETPVSSTSRDAGTSVTTRAPDAHGSKDAAVTAIEMKHVGIHRIHPPLAELKFDFALRNDADRARWFLLPRTYDAAARPLDSSSWGVEAYSLIGKGSVSLGEFGGVPGFQAVKLPARAQVTLHNIKVIMGGTLPTGPLHFEAVISDQVSIGGEPIEAWFESDPLSDATADVSRDNAKKLGSRQTPDLKDVPVALVGAERHTLSADLNAPK